jgi:GT2 family glycosyltransferase/glycosyltransferase involved in cell wall biosynthesis
VRVLVVAHGFPPFAQGGSEHYAHQIATALHARCGDEVAVLTREQDPSRPDYDVRVETQDGLHVTWVNNMFRAVRTFEESYRNPAIAAIAARVVDEWQPDVVHMHHLTCLSTDIVEVLAARGIPMVYTLHDYWLLCHRGQRLDTSYDVCDGPDPIECTRCVGAVADAPVPGAVVPVLRAVEARLPKAVGAAGRRALESMARAAPGAGESAAAARTRHMRGVLARIDRFLSPSDNLRQWFIGQGVPADQVTLSPYGIDGAVFRSVPRESSPHLRIGFLGTLMVSKGPDVLLEAFARLEPGRATLDLHGAPADYHGDASFRERLAPLLRVPGARTMGPRPHAEIPAVFASMDVLVVPSIWPENSPIVIREALLSGVPVVASRIGGMPELVADGRNGLLFEPRDVADLEHVLRRVLDERGLLETLRAGARATTFRTLMDDARAAHAQYESLIAAARDRPMQPSGPRPVAAAAPHLAAVVVNHRTPDETWLAVSSLLGSRRRPDRVYVVDNDDGDAWRARAAACGADVVYLHTGANLGFTGGVNVGVRAALAAGADAVVLVNSDAVLAPGCLGALERAWRDGAASGSGQARARGIVAPLLLARSDPATVASAGIDYDRSTGRMRERDAGLRRADVDGSSGPRVAASGCVLLVSRAVWEHAGLLDERLFFGFEDIDLCLRAQTAGFTTWFEGGAVAYHEGGGTLSPQSPRRFYFAARNHLLLARDHPSGGALLRVARPCLIVVLNLMHALTAPGGARMARVAATLSGVADYVVGRFGSP